MTEHFKHRCVQDLAWAIQSPPMISGLTAMPPEPACCARHSAGKEQSRVFILPENFWANVQIHDSTAVPIQS